MKGILPEWIMGIIPAVLVALFAATALGAYLESDAEGRPPLPVPPPPTPRPPGHEAPVVDFVTSLVVGRPYTYGGLTVFPLLPGDGIEDRGYIALDEARARGLVNIYETKDVSSLEVENRSRRYLFLVAGELLVGGWQNRVVREDVLITPMSGRVRVPVYCGERSRWRGKHEHFDSGGRISSFGMRQMIQKGTTQEEVWSQVERELDSAKVKSPTRDLAQVYDDRATQNRLREYRERIVAPLPRSAAGVVVVRERSIAGADIFADSELFRALREKVLDSYVLDWGPWVRKRPERHIGPDDVRRFLHRIRMARISFGPTPGGGLGVRVSGAGIEGTGLVFRREVVHLSLYEGYHILPLMEER